MNYRTKPDILSYRWDRKVDNQQENCKFFAAGILVLAYLYLASSLGLPLKLEETNISNKH